MHIYKKIAIRIIFLLVLLAIVNAIYSKFGYQQELEKYAPIGQKIKTLDQGMDILYLSHENNTGYLNNDLDRRGIDQLLQDYYPELRLKAITFPRAHPGIYADLSNALGKDRDSLTIVLALNLRSFGPGWKNARLEKQYRKDLLFVQPGPPLWNRFLVLFNAYFHLSEEENWEHIHRVWNKKIFTKAEGFKYTSVKSWDRAVATRGIRDEQGKYDVAKTETATQYIKSYAFRLDGTRNEMIRSLDEIVSTAEKNKWKLVLSMLPVNIEKAEGLVGNDLMQLVMQNRHFLMSRYLDKGLQVIDLTSLLPGDAFIEVNQPTSRYDEMGRKEIAYEIANALSTIFPEKYQPSVRNYHENLSVANHDCEKYLGWGQEGTFSNEQAHSGHFSSKVYNAKPYGLTFEYEFSDPKQFQADSVIFECMLYTNELPDYSSLVIDQTDSTGKQNYFSIPFDQIVQYKTTDQWQSVTFRYPILKTAKQLKVYPLNNSTQAIYIDDITIRLIKE